mmetsp:Transcript_5234/g.5356  ORF Transcript_5234/g.5356 Transcript_5234/m.5356 type:complete len:285 (-) Transcript_5234:291-1145(-)
MYCSTRRRRDIYDEEDILNEDEKLHIPSNSDPNSKYSNALRGYTGFIPRTIPEDEIEKPYHRIMIRGYSGHLNNIQEVCGTPLIPSIEKQQEKLAERTTRDSTSPNTTMSRNATGQLQVEQSALGSSFTNFRTYGKHMELEERYHNAIQKLWKRGQTQQMLLRMVQCKLSENVSTFAQQYCRSRKIYEYFDLDSSGTLDEHEFRQFLELQNCYFDDIQSLALFAYFDSNKTGGITWEQFEAHAIISNPQGGTGVIPKAITANIKSNDWKSVSRIAEKQNKALKK